MGDVRLGGRVVGQVDGEGVFRRRVRENQVLRQPPAIALHQDVLDQLRRAGCRVVVFEMPDGSILTAPFSVFDDHGFPLDRGAGPQVGVRLDAFTSVSVPVVTRAARLGW